MGVLDLPSPWFAWLDAQMSVFLPAVARLAIWGVLAAVVSMALYRALSSQEIIRRNRLELARARSALDRFDGDLRQAWPLLGRMLKLACARVGRVAAPALVASLPLLSLLAWLSTAYGYDYEYLSFGPSALRSWEVLFFAPLLLVSLLLKRALDIE